MYTAMDTDVEILYNATCDTFGNLDIDISWSETWSLICAHSGKTEQYERLWDEYNIPFLHGSILYLISKLPPYIDEVKFYSNPAKWVIRKYEIFKPYFPSLSEIEKE